MFKGNQSPASSVKQAVKKGVKATYYLTIQKTQQALSVTSTSHSTHSYLSTVNINNIFDSDYMNVEKGDSKPEVELTPEQELGMCLLY